MTTPKRRKIETSEGSRPRSAFALRQQLLAASSPSSPATIPEPQSTPESQASTPTPSGRSPVKPSASKRPAKADKAEAPQEQGAATIPPLDPSTAPTSDAAGSGSDPGTKPGPQQFSTFRPNKSNSRRHAGGILELRLKDSERFLVLGSYGIRVISGEVTVAGAAFRHSEDIRWVHAPHCHGIPVVRCSDETTLELHPHPQAASLRKLERISPLFRSLWHEPEQANSKKGAKDTFRIICTSDDAPKRALIQDLRSLPAWNKKLAGLAKTKPDEFLSVMLCGPKSSGKSTFGRILGNRLLTTPAARLNPRPVAVLDLDPGQPEYTPAGTIALVRVSEANLGPSFTNIAASEQTASVVKCHAIASVSPASDPDLYLECALDLYQHYQKTCAGLPLIINTPGWILGTGLDLLTEMVKKFKPTEVIYMSEDGPKESVEGLRAACKEVSKELVALPSQQSEPTPRTAAHLRSMQALAYFHMKRSASKQVTWDPAPLSSLPPLVVSYTGQKRGILAIISYEYQPPAELLAETINGSMLCLVETEDSKAFSRLRSEGSEAMDVDDGNAPNLDGLVSRTPDNIPFIPNSDARTLDPLYSQTLGLVLLRGIDAKSGNLQLLTPIPLKRIAAAKEKGRHLVLVHGKLDSPGWAYTEDLYHQSFGSGADPRDDTVEVMDENTVEMMDGDTVEVMDEDTDSDDSDREPEDPRRAGDVSGTPCRDVSGTPWIEVLDDNAKRPVGSRVWRVRRDLGRTGPGGD